MPSIVIDLESIRLEVTKEELKILKSGNIPTDLNTRILQKLDDNNKYGWGVMENWEEID